MIQNRMTKLRKRGVVEKKNLHLQLLSEKSNTEQEYNTMAPNLVRGAGTQHSWRKVCHPVAAIVWVILLILTAVTTYFVTRWVLDRTDDTAVTSDYSYTAAVVEFAPDMLQSTESPPQLLLKNSARYVDIMATAALHSVDIIVFPECALSSIALPGVREDILPYATEFPKLGANPCDDPGSPQVLQMLSCAARKSRMYVVFNLPEVVFCISAQEECSPDGKNYYNSNMALDRNGTIVAKYRKFNLYDEPGFNITNTPDHSWFDTDFGVRFGTFICFDIIFGQPSMELLSEYNISNIAYPTAWYQIFPFFMATSVQAGWARANNVNLLAAGYSDTSDSNAGSGIHKGKDGPLVFTFPNHSSTKLLIANMSSQEDVNNKPLVIPITENLNSSLTLLHDLDFKDFNTSLVTESEARMVYQTDLFSCEVNVSLSEMSEEGPSYRLVAFAGDMIYYDEKRVYTEICGVTACANSTLESCSYRADFESSEIVFDKISISVVTRTDLVSFAVTVDENLLPFTQDSYGLGIQKKPANSSVSMYSESSFKNFIAFAVFRSA